MSKSFQSTRKVALERANHECAFCGVTNEQHEQDTGKGLDVHHVLPRSAGGSDKPSNLLAVCRKCHKTLEHSQGAAMKEIAQKDENETEIKEKFERVVSDRDALLDDYHNLISRVHELERRNRDVNYYKKLLDVLSVDGEIVSEMVGTNVYSTTDSEKAIEQYKEWGSSIERTRLYVTESDVDRNIDSIKERLEYIERRGYKND